MARSGVKNLVIASRSGLDKESAQILAKELQHLGVNFVAAKCDVGDLDQLQKAMAPYKESMPPIRGVIQSALVLKVSYRSLNSSPDWLIDDSSNRTRSLRI